MKLKHPSFGHRNIRNIPIYIYQTKNLKHPDLKGAPSNIMDHYNWKYVYLEAEQ